MCSTREAQTLLTSHSIGHGGGCCIRVHRRQVTNVVDSPPKQRGSCQHLHQQQHQRKVGNSLVSPKFSIQMLTMQERKVLHFGGQERAVRRARSALTQSSPRSAQTLLLLPLMRSKDVACPVCLCFVECCTSFQTKTSTQETYTQHVDPLFTKTCLPNDKL